MTYPGATQDPYGNTAASQSSSKRKPILITAICVAVVFAIANAILATWLVSGSGGDSTKGDDNKAKPKPSEVVSLDYEVPGGFSAADGVLFSPLYSNGEDQWEMMMHETEKVESVWVAPYIMDEDTSSWDEADYIEQVQKYAEQVEDESTDTGVNAEPVVGPDGETNTAYVDSLRVTSPRDNSKITYDAYHFFDGYHLIQVGCQYKKDKDAVLTACSELMQSLSWSE